MISIRVINPPRHTIGFFGVDQQVFLDTDAQFDLRLSKNIEEVKPQTGNFSQQASVSNTLPRTPRNLAILEQFEGNVYFRNIRYLDVEVRNNGDVLPINKLTVINWQDRNRRIEVELIGTGWVSDLETLLLKDLNLGTFEFTLANVSSEWENREALAYPTLAHYGGWNNYGQAGRKDLRFWFNLTQLLEKALCSKGWALRSPFFQDSIGKHLYGYISGKRWFSYRNKNDEFKVEVGETVERAITGDAQTIIFDDISDPLGLYNNILRPGEYIYPPTAPPADLRIIVNSLNIQLFSDEYFQVDPTFVFSVYRNRGGIFDFLATYTTKGSYIDVTDINLSFEFLIEEVQPGDSFGIVCTYGDIFNEASGDVTSWKLKSASIFFAPDRYHYTLDDTIYLADLIDPELNALQLAEAMAHLIDGKVETKYDTKEVVIYTPFDTLVQGEVLEGFFQRGEIVDITDKIVPRSRLAKVTDIRSNRYLQVKFKDTTDSYIQSRTKLQPYARTVDLAYGKAETTKIENELFEPTFEVKTQVPEIGDGIDSGAETPFLMALWDNEEGQISKELGFRVGYNYGLINQLDDLGNPYQINFEGNTRLTFGYISQVPTRRRNNESTVPTVHLAFADFSDDFYRLFYQQRLREQYAEMDFNFLIYLSFNDYLTFDFRKPVGFFYNDTFLIYQMIQISDFNLEVRSATPVDLKLIEC